MTTRRYEKYTLEFVYFNFTKINLKYSETTLHSKIGKVHFRVCIFYIKINLKVTTQGQRYTRRYKKYILEFVYFNALLYENQLKAFRDKITLEDRKSSHTL